MNFMKLQENVYKGEDYTYIWFLEPVYGSRKEETTT